MPMIRVKMSMCGHVKFLKDSPVSFVKVRQFFRPVGQQNDIGCTLRICW